MKIKEIEYVDDKQVLLFKNGVVIETPSNYEFEVGMKLKLKFENILILEDNYIINIFTLSNKDVNFNLFINTDDSYEDKTNMLSSIISYGKLDKEKICLKSPIEGLVTALNNDDECYNEFSSILETLLNANYVFSINSEDPEKTAKYSVKCFLEAIGVDIR